MNASYRFGLTIVLATLGASALFCLAFAAPYPDRGPQGERLGDIPQNLGSFRLVERSGEVVTEDDLADHVWIAAFVFSRCTSSCPVISAKMKALQDDLAGTGVKLVSLSVDPEHDTPQVLRQFASRYQADPNRWWFLTGKTNEVYELILDRFKISVSASSLEDRREGAEMVAHSDRLVLVGPSNQVLGAYVSSDPMAMKRLEETARSTARIATARRMGWVLKLPAVNASLNATCATLLVLAWVLIRRGQIQAHAATMMTAIGVSALFLGCYLVYHFFVGSVAFQGVGPIRILYLTILLSHTILAVVVVPLILVTIFRAFRRQFTQHASIARVTFPVWLYVSITGVIVYVMLYQIPLSSYR